MRIVVCYHSGYRVSRKHANSTNRYPSIIEIGDVRLPYTTHFSMQYKASQPHKLYNFIGIPKSFIEKHVFHHYDLEPHLSHRKIGKFWRFPAIRPRPRARWTTRCSPPLNSLLPLAGPSKGAPHLGVGVIPTKTCAARLRARPKPTVLLKTYPRIKR